MSDLIWQQLDTELDACRQAGIRVEFWWRDDDAAVDCPALQRLVDTAADAGTPLAVAAIPAQLQSDAIARLVGRRDITILQHGFDHQNHAGANEKKQELGSARAGHVVLEQLRQGAGQLKATFGEQLQPVLVPPWNRISDALIAGLPNIGLHGLSRYQARPTLSPTPDLVQINTHVDIIDWKGDRSFIGTEAALALVCQHLANKRAGRADVDEPTGLLSHHQVMDEPAWNFVAAFIARTRDHPDVHWPDVSAIFVPTAGGHG